MYRRILLFTLLFTALMSIGSCDDIWSLSSHNELTPGGSFVVGDYLVTLVTAETNTTTGGFTILVQYKNDKTGDVGSKYMSLNDIIYFNNNTYMMNYPNQFAGKHFLNVYALDVPNLSMVALYNKRYENETIEVGITMKNNGMTATDITTEIILPENYESSEDILFDDIKLDKFEVAQGTVILERDRAGVTHFELDTTYEFLNPAMNETQKTTIVKTIDIFEDNTTLVQDCSLEDDEVFEDYYFRARANDRNNTTNSEQSEIVGETIVAVNSSVEEVTDDELPAEVINKTPTETPIVTETPTEVLVEPTDIEVPTPTPIPTPVAAQLPQTQSTSPSSGKFMQIMIVAAIAVFGIFIITAPNRRKQKLLNKQRAEQQEAEQLKNKPIHKTIDPALLDEEDEEEATFSWNRGEY